MLLSRLPLNDPSPWSRILNREPPHTLPNSRQAVAGKSVWNPSNTPVLELERSARPSPHTRAGRQAKKKTQSFRVFLFNLTKQVARTSALLLSFSPRGELMTSIGALLVVRLTAVNYSTAVKLQHVCSFHSATASSILCTHTSRRSTCSP